MEYWKSRRYKMYNEIPIPIPMSIFGNIFNMKSECQRKN